MKGFGLSLAVAPKYPRTMFGTSFLSIYAQALRASLLSGLMTTVYIATNRPARATFLTAQQQKDLLLALFAVAKHAQNAKVLITHSNLA